MPILFYSVRESPYGCFSNFSPHPFEFDGKRWPTSEHYFQAQKFAGTPFREQQFAAMQIEGGTYLNLSDERMRDIAARIQERTMRSYK